MTGDADPGRQLRQLTAERDAALERAESSRRRLQALHSTTAAVTGATSTEAAVDAVLDMGLRAAGADAGYVAVRDGGHGPARVVAVAGEEVGGGHLPDEVPADGATAVGRAITDGRETFAADASTLPPGEPVPALDGRPPASVAVVPLRSGDDAVGALVLSFGTAQGFDGAQVAGLVALANLTAAALVRVRLLEEEGRARAQAAALAERNAFLAEATAVVSAPHDERTVLERLARLCVPRLGDWCSITRPHGDELVRVIVHHHDPALQDEARQLEGATVPITGPTPVATTFRTGTPQLLHDLGTAMARDPNVGPAHVRLFHRLGDDAGITVPIGPPNRPVGVLAFAVGPHRRISDDDVSLAMEIALRAGIAVTHAVDFARERDAAALLQRAILPTTLPAVPGAELAAAYRPADRARAIGGDWFDACLLGDDRIAVVVGDVAGHGTEAAAAMGQLRSGLRAHLFAGLPPGEALGLLNRMLVVERSHHYATVVVAVVDVATGAAVMANAGHLPPLLSSCDDEADLMGVSRGPMLGIFADATYPEDEFRLAAGESLVLFTDGLVERRREPLDDSMAALCRAVSGSPPGPGTLQAWCDSLVRDQGRTSDHDDDSCVLVVRRASRRRSDHDHVSDQQAEVDLRGEGGEVPPLLRLDLEARPGAARTVRRWLGTLFAGHPRLSELQLCATELITNAVIHAGTPLTVVVDEAPNGLRVSVRDASPSLPERRRHDLTAPGGRGLRLLDALTEGWGVEPLADGKVVWFDFPA